MPDQKINLVAYDETWPTQFAREAALITEAIAPWLTGGVHHVGSTAVPGLSAKPIIDIMAVVADLPSSQPCIDILAGLHYLYAPYRADEMHWFCKPDPEHRTHHLHLVPTGSERFRNVLAFRDHLRTHPDAATGYESLKQQLAARFPDDRNAYTDGKAALIAELTATARREAGNEPPSTQTRAG
jgi:GrpB-like predicted nucleotidyltransferase (UPF0157 family)